MKEELNEQTVQQEAEKATELLQQTLHTQTEPVVSAKALLNVGAHLGHKIARWNPKMRDYIFTVKSSLHILDLGKTVTNLQDAYHALRKIVLDNGKIIIVGTKPCAAQVVKEEANRCGSFYVNFRWLGGTLTNFKTISKRIKLLKTLENENEQGLIEKLPKKEANDKLKLLNRLKTNLDGIKEMRREPQAIIVVDPKWEHNAVAEARKLKIPVFALLDTNSDPSEVDYVIPCNDDSEASVRLVLGILCDAIAEAKGGNCMYAYKEASEVSETMADLMKNLKDNEKLDETKSIRSKIKDDHFAIMKKDKKRAIRNQYFKKKTLEQQRLEKLEQAAKEQQEEPEVAQVEEKAE